MANVSSELNSPHKATNSQLNTKLRVSTNFAQISRLLLFSCNTLKRKVMVLQFMMVVVHGAMPGNVAMSNNMLLIIYA